MGFFDKFNKAKKNKKKDFVKEEASTNEGIKPIIRASTSVSSATKDESSKGTTTATTLSSMTFEEQVNYEAIPILEQTKLPRGGVSVHTEGVGRVQFGIPPETIKDSMNLGLDIPVVYIVPVDRFCREMGPSLGMLSLVRIVVGVLFHCKCELNLKL